MQLNKLHKLMICNQTESLTISSSINAIRMLLAADFSKLVV